MLPRWVGGSWGQGGGFFTDGGVQELHSLIGPEGPEGADKGVVGLTLGVTGHVRQS